MKLELLRFAFGYDATLGVLKCNGSPRWFTLEDADRTMVGLPKVAGKTAIPIGVFPVRIKEWSPKFKRAVPELHEVPQFTDILIHPGNTDEQTSGCVLPGMQLRLWRVIESTKAFTQIFQEVKKEETTIAITRTPLDSVELTALKRRWTVDYLKKKEGVT